MKICKECNKEFNQYKRPDGEKLHSGGSRIYCWNCNPPIQIRNKKGEGTDFVNCKNCNKEFIKKKSEIKKSPNNFCSHTCSAIFNNGIPGIKRVKPKLRECKECKNTYTYTKTHRSSLCPNCSEKYTERFMGKTLTVKEYLERPAIKNKHPSWKNSHIRNLNRSWNKEMTEHPCLICGYTKHTELAHIKSITSFPETATIGEINHPSNNVPLCRNHHWEFDHNLLKPEELQKIKEWQENHKEKENI